jgi:FlaA1/EpsC-like NDP-sugar epimerase
MEHSISLKQYLTRTFDKRLIFAVAGMQKSILNFPRKVKRLIVISLDVFSAFLSSLISLFLCIGHWFWPEGMQWLIFGLSLALIIPVFFVSGVYNAVHRYNSVTVFLKIGQAVTFYGIVFFFFVRLLHIPHIPLTVGILQPMLLLLFIVGTRVLPKIWLTDSMRVLDKNDLPTRVLIYGAGAAGVQIANEISRNSMFSIAGFIDDDKQLHGRTITGKTIFSLAEVSDILERGDVDLVLIAIPSACRQRRNSIIEKFRKYPVRIQMLPGVEALVDGRVTISDLKEIEIEDLLGRETVRVDHGLMTDTIVGNVVMVTGAGGSIGSELCRQLLFIQPTQLILVDNGEYNLYKVHLDLENLQSKMNSKTILVPVLGDVTDKRSMAEICREFKPSVIYHAAAYKHVPIVEYNPIEGVRNNVFGTVSVAQAAIDNGVNNFVLISTDKAVRPTSIMGASKRLCELVLQALASEKVSTCFSMVRFGNVLGSSGSVIPLFRNQINKGGPLTITHKDITRYFMTITEAAQLVIQAGAMAIGGEVFLLDMGEPVKIFDLARRMIELSGLSVRDDDNPDGDIDIVLTGLRPGEKLYEELLIADNPLPTPHPRIFKAHEYYLSLPDLMGHLSDLQHLIDSHNNSAVKECLLKIINSNQLQEIEISSLPEKETINEASTVDETIIAFG